MSLNGQANQGYIAQVLQILTSVGIGIAGGAMFFLSILIANVALASRTSARLRAMTNIGQVALVATLIALLPLSVGLKIEASSVFLVALSIATAIVLVVVGMFAVRKRDVR